MTTRVGGSGEVRRRALTNGADPGDAVHPARREEILSAVLSSVADLIFAVDAQDRLLWANESCLRVWGRTLEECRGRTPEQLGYSPTLAQRIHLASQEVFRSMDTLRDEMAFTGADGVQRHYEYVFTPSPARGSAVDFVVASSRETTARKRSEEALKESVAEFRTLASAMPQIVWSAAADGEFIYLNQRWLDDVGLSLSDSLGHGWLTAVHPDDRPTVSLIYDDAIRSRDNFTLEMRLRNAGGDYRWLLVRGVPVLDEAGRPLKWIGTCTDIDEIKEAELAISRANAALQVQGIELRTLFDLVPAMVWYTDRDSRVLQINHRAASHAGLPVDQAVGRWIPDIFPELGAPYLDEDQQILASRKPRLGKLERISDVDGKQYWVQGEKVPCLDQHGNVIGIMVMKHDITERKQVQDALAELNAGLEVRVRERTAELALARDEAERANRAKSTFLATMSHEIRTPMSGLVGLLELLDLTQLDQEQRSTLRVARESGQALKEIIDGILDFSKIEANSLELNARPASLRDVLEGVAQLHATVASSKGLVLNTLAAADIGALLMIDPLRLGQILNNFVGNAIKFTERGSITLAAECVQRSIGREHLRITVRDTGPGIPAENLGRLFQPFAQADARTAATHGGTGLGLYIARRLAELMQGSVSLSSEVGLGTTLTLLVAFEVCAEEARKEDRGEGSRERLNMLVARRPTPQTVQQAEASRTLLLIVDDHPVNRMLLLRQVSTLGYAAEDAADGLQALQAWQSGRYAAIITDCNMPGMSGFELARSVRKSEQAGGGMRTTIIGCTANALAETMQACLAAGMDGAIIKPLALDEMCDVLDRWVPLSTCLQTAPHLNAPGTRAAAGADGLLDVALLGAISAGDAGALVQVLDDLRRTNDADAFELRRAVRREDFAQAVHLAHRMRGACAMLGATLLADACAEIQACAGRKDSAEVHARMRGFEMELLRLNNFLDTFHDDCEAGR